MFKQMCLRELRVLLINPLLFIVRTAIDFSESYKKGCANIFTEKGEC